MPVGKVAIIVQARMGSTRFPGKMMSDFLGRPVLEWVLRRCQLAQKATQVVLATSTLDRDTALAELARTLGVEVFRGDEEDVLGRFLGAARQMDATVVARVCADRVVVDPGMIDLAIETYFKAAADITFNHVPDHGVGFPYGMGAEVFARGLLERLDPLAAPGREREHVLTYAWDRPQHFTIVPTPCPTEWDCGPDRADFVIDEPADAHRLAGMLAGITVETPASDLVERWRRHAKV